MMIPWEAEMMRMFVGESDLVDGRPLYQTIAEEARKRGMAGITVLRGIVGFGASSREFEDAQALSEDSPIIIEIVDSPERIRAFLVDFSDFLSGGLLTVQPVRVLAYRSDRKKAPCS